MNDNIITSIEDYDLGHDFGYEVCTKEYCIRLTIDPDIRVGPSNYYDITTNHDLNSEETEKKFIGAKIIGWNEERIKFNAEVPEDSEIFKLTNNKNIWEAVILTINTSVGDFKIIGYLDVKRKDYDYFPFKVMKEYF